MVKRYHILVIFRIDYSSYGREVARGVADFAKHHKQWHLTAFFGLGISHRATSSLKFDGGVIFRNDHGLLPRSVPRVLVGSTPTSTNEYRVQPDNQVIAQLGADHLAECGLQRFSFIGGTSESAVTREAVFRKTIRSRKLQYLHCPVMLSDPDLEASHWQQDLQNLSDWIKPLPKPIGMMAYNDVAAQRVLEACKLADCRVPEEVALLGVDNDDLMCELADPPLSSINPNARRAGYEAASMLASILESKPVAKRTVLIPPGSVAVRRSTDLVATEDLDVAQAVRFIREHANQPLSVDDVIEAVSVSRRSIERRFSALLGRSIHAEIRRVKILHAKQLLADTQWPITHVARQCGFPNSEYFTAVFRTVTGQTPRQYRQQF